MLKSNPLSSVAALLQTITKTCGETTWKAAATQGKSFAKKTVTGCMLASCRHSMVLGGLDMHRGEIYAYPYALQVNFKFN